jgi:hypothetical protein
MPMQCAYHPDREPVGACVECGRLICVECKALLGGRMYCTPCADKKFVSKQAEPPPHAPVAPPLAATPTGAPPPAAYQGASPTPPAAPVYQSTAAPAATNIYIQQAAPTSALSESDQLKGWNWGAFMFSWIWGLVNHVWISFVILILPGIWNFVLGAKGNEWAWKAKQWESIEAFKKHQKAWKPWAILIFVLSLIGSIGSIIFWIIVVLVMGAQLKFG